MIYLQYVYGQKNMSEKDIIHKIVFFIFDD